jgi:tetratricopeptide (TPR) repeat protein
LINLVITPFFRVGRVELLWLIPSLCLFAAVALSSLRRRLAWLAAGVVVVILLARSLFGVPLPYPGRARAASDYSTAVLDRPVGWPSRDAGRWLLAHTSPQDRILLTAYTFTDPLLLQLSASHRVIPNGDENWGLLRNSANRIKFVVFTQDYRAYAQRLADYADTHFTLPSEAQFPNYAIYDCQKDGRFVAYPDAYSSGSRYLQAGMDFLQRHDWEDAVSAFKEVLKINPQQPVASKNLAVLSYQLGRDAEGLTQAERNIRFGIEPAVSYGILGQIRERQGDLDAARTAYEKSLALDPQNAVTRQLLTNLESRLRSRAR